MKEYVKLNVASSYDDEEAKEVYVNLQFVCAIEKEEEHLLYSIKMINGDTYKVKELPDLFLFN